jgi:hypothetical protein
VSESVFEGESLSDLLSEIVLTRPTTLSEVQEIRLQIPGGLEFKLKRHPAKLEDEAELNFEVDYGE